MSGDWCLIESDPGVFTELISNLGVKAVQVEEVWDLEELAKSDQNPVYGLIFLFKWEAGGAGETRPGTRFAAEDEPVYYAKQVIQNACGTMAILSILLNSEEISLGPELEGFKSFTKDFSPDLRGMTITNSDVIRAVHNSFARSDPFINEGGDPRSEGKEDLFHFISYVPVNGSLYELDGLAQAAVNLGPCTGSDWLEKVRPVIQDRLNRYLSAGEIRFNLMAVIKSKTEIYTERLQELSQQLSKTGEGNPLAEAIRREIATVRDKLRIEKEKLEAHKKENERRRHNFIPFIYEVAVQMAKAGKLSEAISQGKKEGERQREMERVRRKEGGGE